MCVCVCVNSQPQPTTEPRGNCEEVAVSADQLISRLNEQLHEKDMKLTDVRLEALSSAHQLEQLREMLSRMKVTIDGGHSIECKLTPTLDHLQLKYVLHYVTP